MNIYLINRTTKIAIIIKGAYTMMVFKRKQIVILALILMIAVAGYLQYSYKQGSTSASKDGGKLGEAVYVDNQVEGSDIGEAVATNDTSKDKNTTKKDVSASKVANDYFAQAKMEREVTRGKSADSLKAITEDKNASKETKVKAYDQMMQITTMNEREMRIETLIKEKGFSDAMAIFGDDGSVDIAIKTPSLTSSQTAQVADIVSRQAKLSIDKIHIKTIY